MGIGTAPDAPLTLFELKPERLHELWPFIQRGLIAVEKKVKPDWRPEDVYAALRAGQASCVIVEQGSARLGFLVYYRQIRPFSGKPELFVWAAWDIGLRPDVISAVWRYINNVAISNYGTDVITWGTSARRARSFERKYGWKPAFVTFHIKAEPS
jgi:hypothetical protein